MYLLIVEFNLIDIFVYKTNSYIFLENILYLFLIKTFNSILKVMKQIFVENYKELRNLL